MVFSDLCDSTALGHSRDPEVLAEILQTVRTDAERIVRAHGGVVNQVYGDGVLAVFGFPTPQENEVRRATEAALQLHREIPELPLEPLLPASFVVRLHSGIHSGLVLVGDGDPVQGRYSLTGDALNTAAGLCASAGADEIVVSAETLRGALPFFTAEELGDLSLKGVAEPIPAYRVLGSSGVATRFEAATRRGLTPFVGRETELGNMEFCLQEACSGRLQVVSIVADAGLGKTRLLEEFLRRVRPDCSVHRGYCERYGRLEEDEDDDRGVVAPLQPFLHMLRRFFDIDDGMTAGQSRQAVESCLADTDAKLLGHAKDFVRMLSLPSEETDGSAKVAQQQSVPITALTDLFVALALRGPLVLYIDDWQWADDASRQVLSHLLEVARDQPVLVLTASRTLDPSDPAMSGAILRIGPFTMEEATRTIDALLPHRLELGVVANIHERSGGNPLFIEELCQSLGDWAPGDLADGRVSKVPATLHGLIEARVERLRPEQAKLVRTAAVIGNVIPAWLLEQLTGHGERDLIVRELAMHDLIYSGEVPGSLRFKHGITRDVVYATVGLKERRALHLRIAAALRQQAALGGGEEPHESLAYHYFEGADHVEAAHYAELAGDKAMATASLDRARQQYRAALTALENQSQTAEVRQHWLQISKRWATACAYSPAREQLDILGNAVDYAKELDDKAAVAEAEYWLGWINYTLGDQWDAIGHYERTRRIAEELGDDRLRIRSLATLGQCYAAVCRYPEALRYLDEALQLASEFSPPVSSSYPMACKAIILADRGDFAGARELTRKALETLHRPDLAVEGSILGLHAAILLWQGRWAESLDYAKRAQASAKRVSGPYVFALARMTESYARWNLEQEPEQKASALESLKEASEWLEEQELCLYVSFCHGWVADAMASAGRDGEARDHAQRALDRASKDDKDDHVGEAIAYRALAKVAAHGQQQGLEPPAHYLGKAMQAARARGSRHEKAVTRLEAARLYAATDKPAKARRRLERATRAFEQMDMQWHREQASQLAEGSKPGALGND